MITHKRTLVIALVSSIKITMAYANDPTVLSGKITAFDKLTGRTAIEFPQGTELAIGLRLNLAPTDPKEVLEIESCKLSVAETRVNNDALSQFSDRTLIIAQVEKCRKPELIEVGRKVLIEKTSLINLMPQRPIEDSKIDNETSPRNCKSLKSSHCAGRAGEFPKGKR